MWLCFPSKNKWKVFPNSEEKSLDLKKTSHSLYSVEHDSGSAGSLGNNTDAAKMVEALEKSVQHKNRREGNYRPRMLDAWAMGMTTVLGGTYYGWNAALETGFGSYLISQFLMGWAFMVLIAAIAEIVSMTSFSGGTYGMGRVVLGFFPGFLCASMELMEYAFYTAAAFQFIATFSCDYFEWEYKYRPIIALLLYLFSFIFLFDRNQLYWNLNLILGICCLVILVIYCFACLPWTNLAANASLHNNSNNHAAFVNWFHGGIFGFIKFLPYTTWGFAGIESGALVTDLFENPRHNLSRGMFRGVFTLFLIMMFTLFVGVALPSHQYLKDHNPTPGTPPPEGVNAFASLTYFMEVGWSQLGMNGLKSNWLMIPAQYAMGFGFMLPAAKLFYAMGQSRLLPPIFQFPDQSKYLTYAVIITSFFSYLLCLGGLLIPNFDIENLPILFAFCTYLTDLFAFYRLRTDFLTSERIYRSPFKIPGAILSACFFSLGILSLLFFQENYDVLICWVGIMTFLCIYYFGYAKYIQVFSDQEQRTLLTLHILTMNRRKRMRKIRNRFYASIRKLTPSFLKSSDS
jgi:amino acid transporter